MADRRNTLYPNLIDHDLVKKYPDVVGMAKNIFFLCVFQASHTDTQ